MKRMSIIATLIVAGFTACGQKGTTCDGTTLESTPTICPNDDAVRFGAYVGSAPQKTLVLANESTANLDVSAVSLSGGSQFSIKTSETIPASIAGNKYLLVNVVFAPDAPGYFQSTLSVKSNAQKCAWADGGTPANCGDVSFAISGCGVELDAGTPAECL